MAVNTGPVARPEASVSTDTTVFPPHVPEAVTAAAVNVTVAPLIAVPLLFNTLATIGAAKFVPTVTLCGVPLYADIEGGVLVNVKL